MFRTLIYPLSGACDCVVELPHRSSCSQFVVSWRFGAAGFGWCSFCRLKPLFTVMRRITTFRSTTGHIYDGGPIRLNIINYNIIIHAEACKTSTTQNQSHQISNTRRTENKTTDVVIDQHSRKLLMMDILMSETC